jgi:hypothetical protein
MKILLWMSGIILGAAICVSVANVSARTTAATSSARSAVSGEPYELTAEALHACQVNFVRREDSSRCFETMPRFLPLP